MANHGQIREFQSVEDFDAKIEDYFNMIEQENKQSMKDYGKLSRSPNIAGLCVHMGIVKDTFYKYANKVDSQNNSYSYSVKSAGLRLEAYKLERAAVGQLREIMTIFDLKNNHGYSDKQEITVNENVDRLTAEEIKNKFLDKKKK